MKSEARTKKRAKSYQDDLSGSGSARQTLIEVGTRLFAHNGLGGTSIRDIAKEADLNSSLISYYFDSKEGLYKACLKEIGETRLTFAPQILQEAKDHSEFRLRLKLFMQNLFSVLLDDREIGLIIIREYDRLNSPAEGEFKQTFLGLFELLINYFESAKNAGLLKSRKDSFTLASLFFGCLTSQMRMDHLIERTYQRTIKNNDEREKVMEYILDLFAPAQ